MSSEPRVVVRDAPGETRTVQGRALDLRAGPIGPVDPETVRAAVEGSRLTDGPLVAVHVSQPSRWWPTLADPADDTDPVDRVVAAARSRGYAPPTLRALAAAERELAAHRVEQVDVRETRRQLAETGADVERFREEVATVRGRLQARRAVDADTGAIEAELSESMRRLTEAETDRIAAEQAHAAAERRARRARTTRRRRLRLQDRVANRRRDARRALIANVANEFAAAVEAVPGDATLTTSPLDVDGDPVTAGLAAVRVADLVAPVVDATDRFDSAAAAVDSLGVPVVRC